jgi:hypothetical protein
MVRSNASLQDRYRRCIKLSFTKNSEQMVRMERLVRYGGITIEPGDTGADRRGIGTM